MHRCRWSFPFVWASCNRVDNSSLVLDELSERRARTKQRLSDMVFQTPQGAKGAATVDIR
eukprot:scaffold1803_cov92-Amphora_coffeaeformis.AAC.21